jgi:hypothetical protein
MRRLLLLPALLGIAGCGFIEGLAPPFLDLSLPPQPGRLTLSNFAYDRAHVEAVITAHPDCDMRDGTTVSNFMLPLNATRVIETPPGADVCWRRELEPGAPASPPDARWTGWNRAFLSSGRPEDSRL